MEDKVYNIESVQQFNQLFNVETLHPLVSVVDLSRANLSDGRKYSYGFYCIFLKEADCGNLVYGRQIYDYQEGTILAIAPGQILQAVRHGNNYMPKGWALIFHPDLIRGTSLGENIKKYTFFSYQVNEALHLSDREKQIIKDVLNIISAELEHPIDNHSKTIITNNIELLLNYCSRFYERQFIIRSDANKEILTKFNNILEKYYNTNMQEIKGLPTVKLCAGELCLSSNYFGDLIKKETGRTAQEYIQTFVINRAKDMLLGTSLTISEIAFQLGFQYPTHFSRLFKKSENCTPAYFRISN